MNLPRSDAENMGTKALPEGYHYVSRPADDAHENFLRIRNQHLWAAKEFREAGKLADQKLAAAAVRPV